MSAVDDSKTDRRVIAGRNIKLARAKAGVSQRQLACLLDREQHHVSEWETGKHEPSQRWLEQLAEALGQDWHWFLVPHEDEWDAYGV